MASPSWGCIATFNIVYILLLLVLMTSVLVVIYRLYKSHQQQTGSSKNKTLYYLGLFFFVAVVMWFIAATTLNSLWCFDSMETFYHDMYGASGGVYMLQFVLLLLILFMRLQTIFKDTALALSRSIIIIFWCLFFIFNINGMIIVGAMMMDPGGLVYSILYPLNALLGFLMMFFLVFLYIYKLYSVSTHQESSQNTKILSSITKSTILTLISLTSSIVFMIYAAVVPHKEGMSDLLALLSNSLVLCDVYTNATAIALSFKSFDAQYFKMCGCCHKRVSNIFSSTIAVQHMQEVQSATSKDQSTDAGGNHIESQKSATNQTVTNLPSQIATNVSTEP
eukprot:214404_1